MAGGPLQAADDMVRIISNGLTFGYADKIAAALGEKDTAAKTAAARQRAGLAGDLAKIGGNLYGGKAIITGGIKGVKAVPAVARAAFTKKGAAAALLGLGGLSEFNARTSASSTPAAPKPKAAAKLAPAKPRNTANADRAADQLIEALKAVDSQPPTFSDMAQQVAAQQGGISLRQLGALAEVSQRTAAKPTKAPRHQDLVMGRLASYYDGVREAEIAAGVPQAQADANWASRYESLAKMNPLDAMIRNSVSDEDE